MKYIIRSGLSLLLALIIVLGTTPLSGFVGLDFNLPEWLNFDWFKLEASAETSGMYTYTVMSGNATITDCATSASGAITIPSTLGGFPVKIIGSEAFSGCAGITSIDIPTSVTSIGIMAFFRCLGLTSVIIPSSVMSIGNGAFADCYGLTSITIPNSVTSIGPYVFSTCNGLISIIIPDSVTSIGDNAFYACYRLQSITIPESVKSIGNFAFQFNGLKSVIIPDSVVSIGNGAFEQCYYLETLSIGKGVQSIGYDAFRWCNMTSVIVPDSVTSIGVGAFAECENLISIIVDENNSEYADLDGVLFDSVESSILQYPSGRSGHYSIPNTVTCIGEVAFSISKLTSVNIPNSVISIRDSAFGGSNLTSVTIPESAVSIGNKAFITCYSLETIYIGKRVTSIGDEAFWGCEKITSVLVPDSVTSIGVGAFANCNDLTSIIVDENNSVYIDIDGVLFNRAKSAILQYPPVRGGYYSIPNTVTNIGKEAFSISKLTSVNIPNSVISIGDLAFRGSRLTSITIPNSVTSIGLWSFLSCIDLTRIIFRSTTTIIYDNPDTIPTNAKIIGYNPSTAKTYAERYNKTFELIGSSTSSVIVNVKATEYTTGLSKNIEGATTSLYIGSQWISDSLTDMNGNATVFLDNLTPEQLAKATISASKVMDSGSAIDGTDRDPLFESFGRVTDVNSNNEVVRYKYELHSETIDRSGNWCGVKVTTAVNNKINLTLKEPRLKVNLAVCYYADDDESQSTAYRLKIKEVLTEASKTLAQTTDGHVMLDKIILFSTSNRLDFYDTSNKASMADIRIETDTKDYDTGGVCSIYNTTINSNAYPLGFYTVKKILPKDSISKFSNLNESQELLLSGKLPFQRIQMGAVTSENTNINIYDTLRYSQNMVHELGHYLFGFLDEYLNGEGKVWSVDYWHASSNRPERPKIDGEHVFWGLMDNQNAEMEMSKRYSDYGYLTTDSTDAQKTAQYGVNKKSCEQQVINILAQAEPFDDPDLLNKPLSELLLIGDYQPTYTSTSNSMTKTSYDRRANYAYAALDNSDYINVYTEESNSTVNAKNLEETPYTQSLYTSEQIALVKAQGNGATANITVYPVITGSYALYMKTAGESIPIEIPLTATDGNYLAAVNISGMETGELTLVVNTDGVYLSNRVYVDCSGINDSGYLFRSADNCVNAYVIPVSSTSYTFTSNNVFLINGNYQSVNQATYISTDNNVTTQQGELYSVVAADADIDFSTLSWFVLQNGTWTKITTDWSNEANMNIGAHCNFAGDGLYVLMAKSAANTGLSVITEISGTSSTEKDGAINLSFADSNPAEDIAYYHIYYSDSAFTTATADGVSYRIFYPNENGYDLDFLDADKTVYIGVIAVGKNGSKSAISEVIPVTAGTADIDADGIPDRYCDQYLLWGSGDENKDIASSDDDGDKISNFDEYTNRTDPTNPYDPMQTLDDLTTTIINSNTGFIYGLEAGLTQSKFESIYVKVNGYARLEYTTTSNGFGTGTQVKLVNGATNVIMNTFTLIIFGDVNGDGNIDSIDAGMLVDYENYMITWDQKTDPAYIKAADLNADGNIDSIDAGIAVDTENYMVRLDQRTGVKKNLSCITFIASGGNAIEPITGYSGDPIIAPSNPVKEGYTFAGWDPAIPAEMPAEDITCVAMWDANIYSAYFLVDGEEYSVVALSYGNHINYPSDPYKNGYTFLGWDANYATMPSQNVYINAVFEINRSVSSIEVTKLPNKTAYIENLDGYWDTRWDDATQGHLSFFYYYIQKNGMELTIHYTDGTYAVWCYDENGSYFEGYLVNLIADQYDSPWQVGNNTVSIIYCGVQTTFDVEVVENPVESIEVTKLPDKVTYIENIDGYWNDSWGDVKQEGETFFVYDISLFGMKLTVNYKNGTSDVFTYDYDNWGDFNGYTVYYSDEDQYTSPWPIGNHTVYINYMGVHNNFDVTVVENPVESIEVTKLPNKTAYFENVDGYWNDSWGEVKQEGDTFFVYSMSLLGMELAVNYKNGTSEVFTCDVNNYGDFNGYYLYYSYEDQYTSPWSIGSHTVYISYMSTQSSFDVTVVESPVESIEVTRLPDKITYIENADGYWGERWDETTQNYIPFFFYLIALDGMELTIHYKDGTSIVWSYEENGSPFNGYLVKQYVNQYQYPWQVGNNTVKVFYLGAQSTFDVEVL